METPDREASGTGSDAHEPGLATLLPLWTVGHSNHDWSVFAALLQDHEITAIADVRSVPASGRFPQYNREPLRQALARIGIHYAYLGRELGARRAEPECYVHGQVCFTRTAQTPAFRAGVDRLRRGAGTYRIALLCAEREPLDCHRTLLISRHLANQFAIQHILADSSVEDHAACERRLVARMGMERTLLEPDLPDSELIARAYAAATPAIAYRAPQGTH